MPFSVPVQKAARIISMGGVVAYPTEGVFGLGCLPDDEDAVYRILDIKQRDVARGLILIAADGAQIAPWIASDIALPEDNEHAITWIVPPSSSLPRTIRGSHANVAVRLTTHPVAAALCTAAGSALVSTSANVSGRKPAASTYVLRRQFRGLVDFIVPGTCGPASGPSEIRDLTTRQILRPASQ